jgi:hypothetical protein
MAEYFHVLVSEVAAEEILEHQGHPHMRNELFLMRELCKTGHTSSAASLTTLTFAWKTESYPIPVMGTATICLSMRLGQERAYHLLDAVLSIGF